MTEPVAAATVVPLRQAPEGLEVLMLRRSSRGAFGGLWVFPGGRVEPADCDPQHPEDELGAARRAAVREAREEAELRLEEHDLVVLSHWMPPPEAPRRFATWFFLAEVGQGAEVRVDGGEIRDHAWVRPGEALARRDAGEIELVPPSWMTLRHLAGARDVAQAIGEAASREPERFATHIAEVDGVLVALWEGDAGYEARDPTLPGPRHRLWMRPGGWQFERTS
jgi:8-oxo-dGTP pyrophosphatase MutT (NUDIX family)